MKLLVDEMWPAAIAEQLRRRGHDVVALTERTELRGAPDEAIIVVALVEGRAIFTENIDDFVPLISVEIQAGRPHPKLILTTDERYPRRDPRTLGRVVSALDVLLAAETERLPDYVWLR